MIGDGDCGEIGGMKHILSLMPETKFHTHIKLWKYYCFALPKFNVMLISSGINSQQRIQDMKISLCSYLIQ
jgi:hypothetical protein